MPITDCSLLVANVATGGTPAASYLVDFYVQPINQPGAQARAFFATGTFTSDKNGNVVFSVTTDAPTASAEDCPNPKWTPIITDVTYGTVTVTADGVSTTTKVKK